MTNSKILLSQRLLWLSTHCQQTTPSSIRSLLSCALLCLCLIIFSSCKQSEQSQSSSKQSTSIVSSPQDQTEIGNNDSVTVENNESTPETTIKSDDVNDPVLESSFTTAEKELTDTPEKGLFCLDKPQNRSDISVESACKTISNRLASVDIEHCTKAKLQKNNCSSVKGFPLLVSEFPPLENRKPQGRILVIGGIHADELTSVSIVFRWIEKLNKYHSGLFHWHMIPVANPDSLLRPDAKRTNQNGVDLNRNFPSNDWTDKALRYWHVKQGKNPRRYPGEKAASEPETQWLIDEINTFKPDTIISVHAPYGIVDFDSYLIKSAPKRLGKLHLNLLGTYPGSLGNYAGINRNIPVITVELQHAWEMPPEQESTKIWEDIVKWLKKNVNPEAKEN